MASEFADIKKDYRTAFFVSIVLLVVMVVSGYALTLGRGLEDPSFVQRFILYSILGGVGLLYLLGVNLYNYITRTRVLKSIFHDPEEGFFRGVKFVENPLLLGLTVLALFMLPLYYLGRYSNTFFSGIPFHAQQITTFSNIWADAVFPALAENFFIFIPLGLLYTWNYKKNRGNPGLFWTINLLGLPLVFAFAWMLFHGEVYGSSEVALVSTFFFGFFGVLATMSTVSFIPWALLHFLTNFMLALKKYGLMSSDSIFFYLILVEVLIIILWVFVYRLDKHKYSSGG